MKKFSLVILIILFIASITFFIFLLNSHKIITQYPSTHKKSSDRINFKKYTGMTITSSAFEINGVIPVKYTCDGQSINPPLAFTDVPNTAKSLVMLMDD